MSALTKPMTLREWEIRQAEVLYDLMPKDCGDFCWACGRTADFKDRPPDWNAPWLVERAHIVNKPRAKDRRVVVMLCSLCHKAGCHGEVFVLGGQRVALPRLTIAHLLWLKEQFDPRYYDRGFIRSKSLAELPYKHPLPPIYTAEFTRRRPFSLPHRD